MRDGLGGRLAVVLLAGAAWAFSGAALCAAEPVEKGPRLTDAQFFSMVDVDRPDLAGVREAVAKADWPAAKHAFAEHLRTRQSPRWTFDPKAFGREPKRKNEKADKALRHTFSSIGIDWTFGDTIDWRFNPTTQPDSKWPANHEWTWQLSRHAMWMDLARAWYASGDAKYAKEFVRELESWTAACPVPRKVDNKPFSRWRTIEAGIRTGSVWPEVYYRLLAAPALDDDALVLFLKSWAEHALYLMEYHTSGNWLTMEANGLYHIGALFPEFKDATLWRDTALERLHQELDIQVYPDGSQVELAPGYHGVSLQNFLGPVDLVPLTGCELPADYTAKLERMFAYLLYSMQPIRRTPALNDSGPGGVEHWMDIGGKLFPGREDFRWVATRGKEGRAPETLSCEFPYAGQCFMRSGWDTQALWLCMEVGPFGYGHQHEDKLGVTLTAFGKPLLVEGGVYTYDASVWRKYVLGSQAHNVVLVDGLEQARRKSPRETYVVKEPLPHVWESHADFDHAAGVYDEGWGKDAARVVTHVRHAFFIKPGLFVIADELTPADDQAHVYEALFHFDAEDVRTDGLQVVTQGAGPSLAVKAFGADGLAIIKGQKEPVVQGWLPDSSSGYGGIRPIPTAVFRKEAKGKTVMLYALAPAAAPADCPVQELRLADGTLSVRFVDGTEKSVRYQVFPAR